MTQGNRNFRKSTYSHANGNCVEVGFADRAVAVRDTADRGGDVLSFSARAWAAFAARTAQPGTAEVTLVVSTTGGK